MNEEFTLLDAMEAVDEYLETAYIERIYSEGMSPFFESEKDFNDFLKAHDYDPKSKTIKYNNKRVPIGSLDDFIRSRGDTPNPMSRFLYNGQIQYTPAFAYKDEKNKLRGVHYTDAMKKLNRRDIEYIMGHEYGHIKDFADERKANRAMSFLAKYNYTAIPKEDRREFLEIKKLERSGKSLSKEEKKRISEFKKKTTKGYPEYRVI